MKTHKMNLIFCFCLLSFPAFSRDIITLDGKTYKDVEIREIKPDGIKVKYPRIISGMKLNEIIFIKFKNLSEDIKKELGYDAEKEKQYCEELEEKKRKEAEELKEKQAKKAEELAERKRKEAERAKKQKELKQIILSQGKPYMLTRRTLYNLGGFPSFASKKLTGGAMLFPVYGKYMIAKNSLYLVKNNNLTSADDYVSQCENDINSISQQLPALEQEYKTTRDKLDDILASISSTNGYSVTNYYDEYGRYIGQSEGNIRIESDLSSAQQVLLDRLVNENNNLASKIISLKNELTELENEYSFWSTEIKKFYDMQSRFNQKLTSIEGKESKE